MDSMTTPTPTAEGQTPLACFQDLTEPLMHLATDNNGDRGTLCAAPYAEKLTFKKCIPVGDVRHLKPQKIGGEGTYYVLCLDCINMLELEYLMYRLSDYDTLTLVKALRALKE